MKKILAETQEGRFIEIMNVSAPICLAYDNYSANPYPRLQSEADSEGLQTKKRDLFYNVVGVGWFHSFAEIEEMYSIYMRDPIVFVVE